MAWIDLVIKAALAVLLLCVAVFAAVLTACAVRVALAAAKDKLREIREDGAPADRGGADGWS